MINLSKLNTNEGIDILADLIAPVSEVVSDEEIVRDIEKLTSKSKNGLMLMANLTVIVPKILKRRKRALCEIIAILKEQSVEVIENQALIETIKDVKSIVKNEELLSFFMSLRDTE